MKRSRARIFAFVAALTLAGAARAQDDSAASFFTAGEAAFARGEYRAAALAFEEAQHRSPHGATIYNAALAWERANVLERAADAYAMAAASPDLPADRAGAARARVAELAQRLARLDVAGAADARVSIAHVTLRAPPFQVHLVPGRHTVRIAHASGAEETRAVDLAAGSATSMTIAARAAPAADRAPPPESTSMSTTRIVGFAALGTAVVATGTALTLGAMGLSARDDFVEGGLTDERTHDRAVAFRTGANVAWVTAGVFAVTGAVLVLFFPRSDGKPDARAGRTPGPLLRF